MRTKEFIKMIQEADPEGNMFVRFNGSGMPLFACPKEGYYDGCYSHIEDGKLLFSTEHNKLDIYADTGEHFVESNKDWEDKISFNFDCYVDKQQVEDKKKDIMDRLKEWDNI